MVSLLIFILVGLATNHLIARRGLGGWRWILVILTFAAACRVVFQLQAMVPESWSTGLWIIGVSVLMVLAMPVVKFGRLGIVVKTLLLAAALAYPLWLAMQMAMVYAAIQSDDPQTAHQRVDFEAMRDDVERQLSRHFDAVDAALASRDPVDEGVIAGVKSIISSGVRNSRRWLVKRVARSILTPSGLKKVLNHEASEADGDGPPWNARLRIENVNRWKVWTGAGWVGFAPGDDDQGIQLRSIEFSQAVLDQIEEIEDGDQ